MILKILGSILLFKGFKNFLYLFPYQYRNRIGFVGMLGSFLAVRFELFECEKVVLALSVWNVNSWFGFENIHDYEDNLINEK